MHVYIYIYIYIHMAVSRSWGVLLVGVLIRISSPIIWRLHLGFRLLDPPRGSGMEWA